MFKFNKDNTILQQQEGGRVTYWSKVERRTWWYGFGGMFAATNFETWRDHKKQETLAFYEEADALNNAFTFLGIEEEDTEAALENERGNLLFFREGSGRRLMAVRVVDVQNDTREIYDGIRVYFSADAQQNGSDPWHIYANLDKITTVEEANAAFVAVKECYRELTKAKANGWRGASQLRFQPFGYGRK